MTRLLFVGLLLLVAAPAFAQSPTPAVAASPRGLAPLANVIARGTCDVDPSASIADGAQVIASCAASGVHAGMVVLAVNESNADTADVVLKNATAQEGRIDLSFSAYGATQNPGTLRIQYVVFQ